MYCLADAPMSRSAFMRTILAPCSSKILVIFETSPGRSPSERMIRWVMRLDGPSMALSWNGLSLSLPAWTSGNARSSFCSLSSGLLPVRLTPA